MTTVAIYTRISSDREETELGIDRQVKACGALVQKMGFKVSGTYVDNNISAFKGKLRPEWERVKQLMADRRIDGIVCWGIDHLYRRPMELEVLLDLLDNRRDFFIIPVNASKIDLNGIDGRNQMRMAVMFVNTKSERKSQRLIFQRAQAAEGGSWNGGRVPLGYKKHPTKKGHLLFHHVEVRALRKVAQMILANKTMYSCYTYWLDTTKRTIAQNTLRNALLSPTIVGLRIHLPQSERSPKAMRDLYLDLIGEWVVQWDLLGPEFEGALDELTLSAKDQGCSIPQRALSCSPVASSSAPHRSGSQCRCECRRGPQRGSQVGICGASRDDRITTTGQSSIPGRLRRSAHSGASRRDGERTLGQIHKYTLPIPDDAVDLMKAELVRGINLGDNPKTAARRIVTMSHANCYVRTPPSGGSGTR